MLSVGPDLGIGDLAVTATNLLLSIIWIVLWCFRPDIASDESAGDGLSLRETPRPTACHAGRWTPPLLPSTPLTSLDAGSDSGTARMLAPPVKEKQFYRPMRITRSSKHPPSYPRRNHTSSESTWTATTKPHAGNRVLNSRSGSGLASPHPRVRHSVRRIVAATARAWQLQGYRTRPTTAPSGASLRGPAPALLVAPSGASLPIPVVHSTE